MSASSRASACISTWLVGPRWCEGATCPEGEAEAGGKGPASLTMVPMPPPGCHRGQGRASAVFGGIRSNVQAASGEWGAAGGRRVTVEARRRQGRAVGAPELPEQRAKLCGPCRASLLPGCPRAGVPECRTLRVPYEVSFIPTANSFTVAASRALANRM